MRLNHDPRRATLEQSAPITLAPCVNDRERRASGFPSGRRIQDPAPLHRAQNCEPRDEASVRLLARS